jgi:predicted RNase H-like nuclease (RuvC/YqgF family)
MNIERVEYRRLKTFGRYENETIGATAIVEPGHTAEWTIEALRSWVHSRLEESLSVGDKIESLHNERIDLERAVKDKKEELEELENRFEAAKAFLEKQGVSIDFGEEMPF